MDLTLYRTMVRIRAFENAAEAASQGGVSAYGQQAGASAKVRGPLHLSTGQEAVPAGVCAHLKHTDYLTSTHRGHGHTLAKGADLGRMMAELFGKATGCNGGKGGSMHIADFSVGMLGANGVVAAGLPIAVGAAHAQKILKKAPGRSQAFLSPSGGGPGAPSPGGSQSQDAITVCFFGDGAINRGPFLEGLNWAKIHDLPVLFVCEDNRWSATTSTDAMTAGEGPLARAKAIGVDGVEVDGNDVFAVDSASSSLIKKIRSGAGPQFLHAITYRFKGHVSVDPATYRDGEEVARALEDDPLIRMEERVSKPDVAAIRSEIESEVKKALEVAALAPWPDKSGAYADIQDVGSGRWHG